MAAAAGGGRGSAPVCWLLACCLIGAGRAGKRKEKSDDERDTVKMPHHSFAVPMDHGVLLDDWVVSGASIFEKERLLLHPGVTDRSGFAWSKLPLLTNDFQVIFHLRVSGVKAELLNTVPLDQALAFWYVDENMSAALDEGKVIQANSWTEGILEQGFGFVGSKGKFRGTGVVLSMATAALNKAELGSYISGKTNDGGETFVYGQTAPAEKCRFDFRNTLNAAQVKIRFRPHAIEVSTKQSASLSWQQCLTLSRTNDPVKSGGYIGFTARSGTASGVNVQSDSVSIVEVDVSNFDENVIGEDMKDVTSKIQDAYRDMLTDDHRHFVDQKSQTDHLLRLTSVINDHIAAAVPEDDRLWKQVAYLDRRMSRLARDCKGFVAETSLLARSPGAGPTVHKEAVEKLKNNIVGIRTLLEKESVTHKKKLESIERSTGEVKAKVSQAKSKDSLAVIEKQSASITKTVRVRGTQMVVMTVVLLGVIVAIGFLMWNRMNYYEKKHFT